MANKRMFAMTIVDSDSFLDLPPAAQALYFHLSMRADDDGFVNKPKSIMRSIKAAEIDMRPSLRENSFCSLNKRESPL
jgi:hypothetical protein